MFPGGEREGLRRLREYCRDEARVCSFAKPDGDPSSLTPECTTGHHPYYFPWPLPTPTPNPMTVHSPCHYPYPYP